MIRRFLYSLRDKQSGILVLELFVLVLGILLALGIDEWRQERDARAAEQEYLWALKADMEHDLSLFDSRVFPEIELRLELSERLRKFSPASVPVTLEEQRDFVNDVDMAGFMNTYNPRRNAMDDLLATGNLRLIRNRALRLKLLNFYTEIEHWRPYDEFARKLIWEGYRNENTGFIPLDAVHMSAEGREAAPRESFVKIVESEVFQRGLLNVRFMAAWQKIRYTGIYESLEQLISELDEEIDLSKT
jgi:hypothetical protein